MIPDTRERPGSPFRTNGRPLSPLPGDYYLDSRGLMVFTERYHLRRGHCCGNACRHCPFDEAGSAQVPAGCSIAQAVPECCVE